jgi:hypothetical protein
VLDAGEHVARWDGRDVSGRAAGAGLYWLRLSASGRTFERKLVVVR